MRLVRCVAAREHLDKFRLFCRIVDSGLRLLMTILLALLLYLAKLLPCIRTEVRHRALLSI